MRTLIDQKRLKELLDYDPWTGVFTWKVSLNSRAPVGQIVGCQDGHGYIRVQIAGVRYSAHRLAWLWMTGTWPQPEIDHRNGIRSDNKWRNLREATRSLNQQNLRRSRGKSRTGLLGVLRPHEKFLAFIQSNGLRAYLGSFPNSQAAHAAYLKAKRELHPGCTI